MPAARKETQTQAEIASNDRVLRFIEFTSDAVVEHTLIQNEGLRLKALPRTRFAPPSSEQDGWRRVRVAQEAPGLPLLPGYILCEALILPAGNRTSLALPSFARSIITRVPTVNAEAAPAVLPLLPL